MTVWTFHNSTLVRVVDGDTLVAHLELEQDIGFHGSIVVRYDQRLRLNRINAPKLASPAGKASAMAATQYLSLGPLTVATVGPYKYGDEWMAEVTLPDGRNLSDVLVGQGYAVYWDGEGPRPADEG